MRRSKAEAQETVRSLVEIARRHFAKYGYAETSLENIANEVELTRGALYHHFRSKKQLFRTVLSSVQEEIKQHVEEAAAASNDDRWQQLKLGCRAFLLYAIESNNRRIMLIDGPSVLGWEEWRAMDEQHSMSSLREQLSLMQQHGDIHSEVSIDLMTHALSGAMNEMALSMAQAEEEGQLETSEHVLSLMFEGFKARR